MGKYLVLTLMVFMSGCSSLAEKYLPENIVTQSSISGGYITEDGQIDLSKVTIQDFEGPVNHSKRNELIAKAISLSDQKCTLHKAGILSKANAWNVGTGTAAILFAGSASVISHAQTAADLAAGAGAITGIQSLNKCS